MDLQRPIEIMKVSIRHTRGSAGFRLRTAKSRMVAQVGAEPAELAKTQGTALAGRPRANETGCETEAEGDGDCDKDARAHEDASVNAPPTAYCFLPAAFLEAIS
jgi:hypothetical protein